MYGNLELFSWFVYLIAIIIYFTIFYGKKSLGTQDKCTTKLKKKPSLEKKINNTKMQRAQGREKNVSIDLEYLTLFKVVSVILIKNFKSIK